MCMACAADEAVEREEALMRDSADLERLTRMLEGDSLREVFKPDRYGFCRVEHNGRVEGFWFSTVEKVASIIKEAHNAATD